MEISRLLLLLSIAFLALAALVAAGAIAWVHQRRERTSQVLQTALDRNQLAAAPMSSTAGQTQGALQGDENMPLHWLNTGFWQGSGGR